MKRLISIAVLSLTACATTYSAGGHVTDACEVVKVNDPRAEGYTIYSCPRPFPRRGMSANTADCSRATREASGAHGPLVPCGWTRGFTDKQAHEIFIYDVFFSETLEHELLHATNRIHDDE
jgi:hypothetical protein